ncbi:MAG: hypothetical protein QFB86_01840 [Patescibacteria group bacterium]|nr:hypothetical protein [Patescibacteria group bacterium]
MERGHSHQFDVSNYSFGNSETFTAERWKISHDAENLTSSSIVIPRANITRDDYYQALEEINSSWQVLHDPLSSKQFEAAIPNLMRATSAEIDAELSTFTSCLSSNLGNVVELAENAALHPTVPRLYISSFGNGKSSYWDKAEQDHIKKTGSFTWDDTKPLPTVAALQRAIQSHFPDLTVARISTNSAGGAYATALMQALPKSSITHAYIKK